MPNYYNPYNYQQPQMWQMQNTQQTQTQPQQIQNGGFVSVRSETEARNYPIAIGTSVTFKDENAPYIYNKTMGFSQFDAPRFDKYRLVKEDASESEKATQENVLDIETINSSIDELKRQTEAIWSEIEELKKKYIEKKKKKEQNNDTKKRDTNAR